MQRAIQLAQLGAGPVSPNPLVGAVLVYQGRILGEGYHRHYGQAHAEVNCLAAVAEADRALIPQSTLYVSLEPCAHFGKTPPCADLIIRERIPRVVIGSRDPFVEVDGKGIERLKAAGVEVVLGVEAEACEKLNRFFFTYHRMHRPFIRMKWAQSIEGKVADEQRAPVRITGPYTDLLMHRERALIDAILVGTDTAIRDNPRLTVRHGMGGRQPLRILIDGSLRAPLNLHLFDGSTPALVIHDSRVAMPLAAQNKHNEACLHPVEWVSVADVHDPEQILDVLYDRRIQSLLVEGGPTLQQAWLDGGYWDEAWVLTSTHVSIPNGVSAPKLAGARCVQDSTLTRDRLQVYVANQNPTDT